MCKSNPVCLIQQRSVIFLLASYVQLLYLGCNYGIGGFHENLAPFRDPELMGSKDAPQKMQFLGAINKVAGLDPWHQNAKLCKTSSESTVTGPKYV